MWSVLSFSLATLALIAAGVLTVAVHQLRRAVASIERAERLTPTKLAELAEFSESLRRAEELLVKVNRREIARAKPRNGAGEFEPAAGETVKDALRRRAGLRAGQPAPHH